MKTKRAIDILQSHRDKLKDQEYVNDEWIKLAEDYLKKYIGCNSAQAKQLERASFFPTYGLEARKREEYIKSKVELFQRVMMGAIEYISNNGVYRPPRKNFFYKLSDQAMAAWIVSGAVALAGAGYWAGNLIPIHPKGIESSISKPQNELKKDTTTTYNPSGNKSK